MLFYLGNKNDLIKCIRDIDSHFASVIFKPLSNGDVAMCQQQITPNVHLTEGDLTAELVCEKDRFKLYRIDLVALSPTRRLSKRAMLQLCLMFDMRDDRISSAYKDCNLSAGLKRKRSYFLSNSFIADVLDNDQDLADVFERHLLFLGGAVAVNNLSRLLIPYFVEGSDCWILCVLDNISVTQDGRSSCSLTFIDPRTREAAPRQDIIESVENIRRAVDRLVNYGVTPGDANAAFTINFAQRSHQYSELITDAIDSGVAIATCMYFIAQDCPIYYTIELLSVMRLCFVLWLCNDGNLPI